MGTCHLPLQGLDQVLLQLPIFNIPWREFTMQEWGTLYSGKLVEQVFRSVQLLSRIRLFATPWTASLQASLSFTISNSWQLNQWCHSTISSSVSHFSCLPSFPASESFPMNQLFAYGGQTIGVSASTSVLPMNIQGWFPLELTGVISLQSNGLSESSIPQLKSINSSVFSLLYGPTLHIWTVMSIYLYMTTGKTIALNIQTFVSKVISLLLLGPHHFCPLLSPSLHEMFPWYL